MKLVKRLSWPVSPGVSTCGHDPAARKKVQGISLASCRRGDTKAMLAYHYFASRANLDRFTIPNKSGKSKFPILPRLQLPGSARKHYARRPSVPIRSGQIAKQTKRKEVAFCYSLLLSVFRTSDFFIQTYLFALEYAALRLIPP